MSDAEREQPRWRRYVRFWGRDIDADISDELRYHVDMRIRDFIQRGLSPDAAREAAFTIFGDEAAVARELRAHDTRLARHARRTDMWQDLTYDLRYGIRQLRNAPRFALTVIAVLALGIGANTAIFSTVDAAFLRPLPFAKPSELVSLSGLDVPFVMSAGRPQMRPYLSDFSADSSAFAGVAAYASGGLNLTGGAEPARVDIAYVTSDFFSVLGRATVVGRVPSRDEFQRGARHVVVLSHGLWQRQFGGDPSAIGRTIALNEKQYTVIGVMPQDFRFPAATEVWLPLALPFGFEVMDAFRNFLPSKYVARLAPNLSVTQAAQHADAIRKRFPEWYKHDDRPVAKLVEPLRGALVGDRKSALVVLMASAALLLLIACANVTNLLLSRAAVRQRELAVRAVLGATRGRVIRQMVVESLVLSTAGGLAALVVARVSMGALIATLPPALAGIAPPSMDVRVFVFALLLATVTSFLFGLWPAFNATRLNLNDAMKLGGAGGGAATIGGRSAKARNVLVVAELSLALMLLVGAGLMIQSLRALLDTDSGMRTDHVVTARLVLPEAKFPRLAKSAFLDNVVSRLRATPGIESAAAVSTLPMEGAGGISLQVAPDDAPDDSTRSAFGAMLMATPGFFRVMGSALHGSDLPAIADTARLVAVINASLANTLWPGRDAVGRYLRFGGQKRLVVGVVADIRNKRLDTAATEQLYFPMAEQPQAYAAIVARGPASTETIGRQLVAAVRSVDASQPLYQIRPMDEVVAISVAPRRTNALLFTTFGALAVVLAGVGVYGVVSYGVAQRTREIGVRVAIGAQRWDVLRLILAQGAVLAGAGIAIGLVAAWALSRILMSILYGVGAHDARVFTLAPLALGGIAMLAVLLPALRATRVDAMTALRSE